MKIERRKMTPTFLKDVSIFLKALKSQGGRSVHKSTLMLILDLSEEVYADHIHFAHVTIKATFAAKRSGFRVIRKSKVEWCLTSLENKSLLNS